MSFLNESNRASVLLILMSAAMLACQGSPGPAGPAGFEEIVLIEKELSDSDWLQEGEYGSYYIYDPRISPRTLIEIYVKGRYSNNGVENYTPLDEYLRYLKIGNPDSLVLYQMFEGGLRLGDPSKELDGAVIVVAISE